MKIVVVSFGKLKTPGMADAAAYYANQLRNFSELTELELKPTPLPDKTSAATRAQVQAADEERLQSAISKSSGPRSRMYLLDERGKGLTTAGWAELLETAESQAALPLILVVGPSLGFSDAFRKKASGLLCLGPQTFPHELARVTLLEQLFRASSLRAGHPYHNP